MFYDLKVDFRLWTELTGELPTHTYRGRRLPDYTEKSVTGDFVALLVRMGRASRNMLDDIYKRCSGVAWDKFIYAFSEGEEPSIFSLRKNGEDKIEMSSLDRALPVLSKEEQAEALAFLAAEEARIRKRDADWEAEHPEKEPVSLPPSDRHDGGYGSDRWWIINGMF